MAASDSDLVISISTDLATIRNQLKKFGDLVDQAGGRASKSFEKAGKSMDGSIGTATTAIQRRINEMVGIADDGAKQWKGALAQIGSGFDGLRPKIDEVTKGFALNRNGMLQLQASGVNAFQAMAAGMSPFRVATMEGAQALGAFVQSSEGGFGALLKSVSTAGAGVLGLVGGPIPAMAIGFTAAAAAGVAAFEGISQKTVTSEEALKEFNDVLKEIGKSSQESADRIKAMLDQPESWIALQAQIKQTKDDLQSNLVGQFDALSKKAADFASTANGMFVDVNSGGLMQMGAGFQSVQTDIENASSKIGDLVSGFESSKISASDLYDGLSEIAAANTFPPSLDELMRGLIAAAKQAEITGKMVAAIGEGPSPTLKKGARPGTQAYVDEQLNLSGRAGNTTMSDLATKLGQQQIPGVNIPTPTQKPSLLDYDPNKTSGRHSGGGSSAPHLNALQRGSQSTDAQLQQLQARLGVLQSINPLLDDYGAAMAEATKKQQLLSDAEKAGVQLSPTQLADIDKQAAAYGRMTGAVNEAQAAQDRLRQNMEDLRSTGKDVLGGFIKDLEGGKSAADALADALQKIADKLLDSALNGLFDSKSNGGSDILGGLGSLFGFGGGGFTQTPGAGLFDSGGYTGPGGKYQPAGIVHKGEVVFSQSDVARNGGVAMVEALRRGYANGGPVAMPSVPSVARSASPQNVHVTTDVGVTVDDDGKLRAYVKDQSVRTTRAGIQEFDRHLGQTWGARTRNAQMRNL